MSIDQMTSEEMMVRLDALDDERDTLLGHLYQRAAATLAAAMKDVAIAEVEVGFNGGGSTAMRKLHKARIKAAAMRNELADAFKRGAKP